ncbi:MAG: Calx-beta domain-containing protein [Marinicella sp.]
MKHFIYLLLLLWEVGAKANNTEWHIYTPTEGITINGVYGDHNQAIIQGNDYSAFDFNDYTFFEIPDQTAVSAFALEPSADSFVVWLSLSTPIDLFRPGDMLRCDAGDCQLVFRVQEDLNLNSPIEIDALDVREGEIFVSFNMGFSYGGQYINPQGVYTFGSGGMGELILVKQSSGLDLGYAETADLTAYDKSSDGSGFSYFFGSDVIYNRTDDTIFSNEILRINSSDPAQSLPMGLSEDNRMMSSFYSLNSGVIGLLGEDIDVDEDVGSLEIELYRTGGHENYVQVLVESMDASAVESVDFNFSPSTAQWFDGDDSNKSVTLEIIDNEVTDGTRTLFLFVFAASEFASIFSIHEIIEIRIIDDETSDLIFADGFE